tara:strand:+ start:3404 stop:3730 length:327 start_codon:yes stop_codon:yes gene_type:complete
MRKYLTFKSVGGGAGTMNQAGEYVLSIDDIVGLGSANATLLNLLLPNGFDGSSEAGTTMTFNVTGTNGGVVLYEALMEQIAAAPGGNFEFIIPEGIAITGFEYQSFIV